MHKWAGLVAGLFLALEGLTGAFLIFRDPIERAVRPVASHVDPAGRAPLPVGTVVAAVERAYPGGQVTFVAFPAALPSRQNPPLEMVVTVAHGPSLFVAADPYTGQPMGLLRGDQRSWLAPLARWHFNLFLPPGARWVVGALGVALLLTALSGIVLFLRFDRSLHARLGGLAALPLAAYALSAVLIVWFRPVAVPPPSGPPAARMLPVEQYLIAARDAQSGASVSYISLAKTGVNVRMRVPGDPRRTGNTDVWLDAGSAHVLRVDPLRSAPLATQIYQWLAAFHFGEMGGAAGQLLGVILGLMPMVLVWTAYRVWRR